MVSTDGLQNVDDVAKASEIPPTLSLIHCLTVTERSHYNYNYSKIASLQMSWKSSNLSLVVINGVNVNSKTTSRSECASFYGPAKGMEVLERRHASYQMDKK